MNFKIYQDALNSRLSVFRFEHSLRVVDTALEFAKRGGYNLEQVRLAALLHDYAKDMPGPELILIARKQGLISSHVEEIQPDLLHGPVGAYLIENDLGIRDREIQQAIRYHTTGKADMSSLESLIYLADLVEPGRTYEGVKELREICGEDLEAGLKFAYDATIAYVMRNGLLIHPDTVEARNWLLEKRQGGN